MNITYLIYDGHDRANGTLIPKEFSVVLCNGRTLCVYTFTPEFVLETSCETYIRSKPQDTTSIHMYLAKNVVFHRTPHNMQ